MKLSMYGAWRGIVVGCLLVVVATGCVPPDADSSRSRPVRQEPTDQPAPITPSKMPTSTPLSAGSTRTSDPFLRSRLDMVKTQLVTRDVRDENVLKAMETVPRHEFVPPEYVKQAYADHPLPIGYGQTISQPYIVAIMTEHLRLRKDSRVLEIGAGSGYQAAILSQLVDEVYSVEIIPELCSLARERLASLGYDNVSLKCADGYYGWAEHAPYDAIIVTCAPDHIPQPLIKQLVDGGRMVLPVGPPGAYQVLWLVERQGEGTRTERLMGVAFVPLTGQH